MQSTDDIDLARAEEYSLLSALLLRCPDTDLLARLSRLRGDSSALGRAHTVLGEAAARTDAGSIAKEYFTLFVGMGRSELLPYASYYLTGFVQGRPLADLRQTLVRIGVELREGQPEPEDHAGILFEMMSGLAGGSIAAAAGTEREIFERFLSPWIVRFFADLEGSASAQFYASVGALGHTFMDIEKRGFQLLEPHP